MIPLVLYRLTQDEFETSIGFLRTPESVRSALLKSPDVLGVAMALRNGEITEDMIRDFIALVTSEYSRNQRLPHDLALAALAVVLELRPTRFAEEYLLDLGRLKLAEMSVSTNVARVCLKNTYAVAKNEARLFTWRTKSRPAFRPMTVVQRTLGDRRPSGRRMKYPRCGEDV